MFLCVFDFFQFCASGPVIEKGNFLAAICDCLHSENFNTDARNVQTLSGGRGGAEQGQLEWTHEHSQVNIDLQK